MTNEEIEFEKRLKLHEEIGALKMVLQKVTEAAVTLITIHMLRNNPSPGQWAEFEQEIKAFGKLDLVPEFSKPNYERA